MHLPYTHFKKYFALLLVVLFTISTPLPAAQAASVPPTVISYQSRLTDSAGNLLGGAGTNYYFKFSIWDSPTVGAGNRVWPVAVPATTTASVRQGVFSVDIGDTANGYPDALNLDFSKYSGLYLQVEVSANNISSETFTPRQQLSSAVFAQVAGAVVGTTTPSLFGTTTPAASSFVTIQATSSTAVALSLLAAQGQSANIFQIQSAALQNLFSISSAGAVSLSGAITSTATSANTIPFASSTALTVSGTASTSILFANNATTTTLGISSIASGSLLKTTTGGAIVAAVAGSDYTNFSYLFPNSATTTLLTFSGGLSFANATSTGSLAINASTTIAGQLNAFGGATFGAATINTLTLGTALSLSQLATQAANTVLANATAGSAAPTAVATSTFFGVGLPGQHLVFSNGATVWAATTTSSCSSGITCSFSGTATSFTNSGVTSNVAGSGIAVSGATGAVTITNTIGYPFPANATTTPLTFSGGLSVSNATSTGSLAVTASTTIAGVLNVGGALNGNLSTVLASTTLLGNALFGNATSSSFGVTGLGTSTFAGGLIISGGGLKVSTLTTASCDVKADTNGNLSCGTDATGAGSSFPFTQQTQYGLNTSATTTLLQLTNGFTASSTSHISAFDFLNATGTSLAITASSTIGGVFNALNTVNLGATAASSLTLTTALAVAQGGTGATTYSQNTPLVYNGSALVATSSALLIAGTTASSTIQGATAGTSTLQGFLTVLGTNSTSTFSGDLAARYLTLTGTTASSTFAGGLIISGGGLKVSTLTTASCDVKADTNGNLSCGTDATGAASAFAFTPSVYGTQIVNATSTGLWLTGSPLGLIASSTFATFASSTQLSNSGATWLTNTKNAALSTDSNGLVVASTTGTLTASGGLTIDNATRGLFGGSAQLSLANIAAGSVLANNSGTAGTPTAVATTSLFAASPGQVLTFNNGVWSGVATTTSSCSSGIACSFSGTATSFTNSGVTSNVAGGGIAVSSATGAVTITNTIGYPFPNNATTTLLTFSGGLSAANATSTGSLAVTASTTIAGQLNALGGATFGSITVSSCSGCSAGGGSFAFTPSVYGTQAVNATSTGLWLTGSPLSLIASSTFATYASSTQLTVSGSSWFTNATTTAFAVSGLGTTTFGGGLQGTYLNLTGAATASSTLAGGLQINGGGLKVSTLTSASCDVKSDTAGNIFCGTDQTGAGGGAFPFTTGVFGSTVVNSTTTALQLLGGLFASTTGSVATVLFDQRGTGNILQLQQAGVDKLTVANGGGLTINAATSDTVKSTTGGTKTTDFDYTGATLATTTATNGYVTINDGTVPANGGSIVASTSPVTAAAVGAGGQVILRSDGKYIIIHGGASATASVWNGFLGGTMSSITVATGGTVATSSISVKRPDGRYVVFHGNGANLSSIFDPYNVTPVVAGPVPGGACTTGTNAFLRQDGKYVVMCGGTTGWGVYDPSQAAPGTLAAGSAIASAWGAGAHALQRDDGTFLIYQGGGTGTFIYNPYANTMIAGPVAPTAIGTSSVSVRRQDGTYLTLPGAINQSFIYMPVSTTTPNGQGTFSGNLGVGPSAALADGTQAIWRQDMKYTLIIGSYSTVVNIFDPGAGYPGVAGTQNPVFTNPGAPLALSAAGGPGLTVFMLSDGRYAIARGGGTGIDILDQNFVTGTNIANVQDAYWESECISNTNLSAGSTLNWTSNSEGKLIVQVRTATSPALCSSASYRTIVNSGDLINATSTADNQVQLKVFFQRELPRFIDQEWGLRKTNMTRYRRVNADPSLYDITVDNGTALHRTQFDFGQIVASTTAPASGPAAVNITNDANRTNALALAAGVGYGSTINAANPQVYNGAFGSHTPLLTATASSTLVMKRPDGKFIIISGSATANAQVYDETLQTFTALGTTPTASTGLGALAFKRPDGKFFIVIGKSQTTTNIFDPVANTFVAGPALTAAAGIGSLLIPLPMGRVLIVHGNLTNTTSIYDPINNTMTTGPTAATVVGPGSIAIPRPDGGYLFIPGMSAYPTCSAVVTTTQEFNPYTMTFTNTGPTNTGGTGPGAFAFQRKDGQWIIVRGGATVTTCLGLATTAVYNAVNNVIQVTGPVITGALMGQGGHAIPRPDGTWLIIQGGTSAGVGQTATFIYQEQGSSFTNPTPSGAGQGTFIATTLGGPAITGINSGAVTFQRSDGKFVVIAGGGATSTAAASTTVQTYDVGWVASGIYRSEQFDLSPLGTKLDSNSTLAWKGNMFTSAQGGVSAEVRTAPTQAALGTSTTREVPVSGGLINPGASDTWLQIIFNFRRSFPSYGGIYTDVWNGSFGSAMNYPQRPVITPVLYEYKVTKDKDLINLQSDGLSIFRVSSGGDVYTQAGGTINTSGADLAERYTSQVELQKGEVVSIDPQNNHGVQRSKYQYQPDILGVVSTDPGFVAGAYTEDSYPIALIGRVPVKVSTENGMIRTGDFLTAASVPGYAMKASLSGRVIGKALESLDPAKLVECPASDIYIPNRKCGVVMVFVNLIDYNGAAVDVAMSDWKATKAATAAQLAAESGLELPAAEEPSTTVSFNGSTLSNRDAEVLDFLIKLKEERARGVTTQSELFADRVSAVSQILSPEIVTNILRAQTVEGLEVRSERVITKTLSTESITGTGGLSMSLKDGKLVIRRAPVGAQATSTTATSSQAASVALAFAEATTTAEAATTTPMATTTQDEVVVSFDTQGNAFFAGEVVAQKVTTGGLSVSGVATFAGGLEVPVLGSASTTLSILSDTTFFGRPYFTSDTGGTAVIKKGAKFVEVVFDREYVAAPIMSASVVYATTTSDEDIDALFADDVRYAVTKRDAKGFTIRLSKAAPADMTFNWIALAVTDAKEFTSKTPEPEAPVPAVTPLFDAETNNATTTAQTGEPATTTPTAGETEPEAGSATTTPAVAAPPETPPTEVPVI